MLRAGLFLGFVIAIGCGLIGWQTRTLLLLGSPQPQTLTLKQLAANGPGDNIHVTLTDIEFGDDYAIETKRGSWQSVFLPAFPPDEPQGGANLKVLVKSFQLKTEADVDVFTQRQTITGVITNSIHGLGASKSILQERYPGVDVSRVWIVEADKSFPTTEAVMGWFAGAVVALLVSLACGVAMWRQSQPSPRPSEDEARQ